LISLPLHRLGISRRAGRRTVTVDYFDFRIVYLPNYLPEIAQVEPLAAARAFHEVIGLSLSATVAAVHNRTPVVRFMFGLLPIATL
jgi:hypothetical protein